MKSIHIPILLVILLSLLVPHAWAAETPTFEISPEQGLTDEVIEEIGPYSDLEPEGFFDRITDLLGHTFAHPDLFGIREAARTMGMILAAVLLSALLKSDTEPGSQAQTAGCLAITAACANNLHAMMGLGTETLSKLHNYLRLLLPGMTSLMAASGCVTRAGMMSAVTGLGFTVLLRLISGVLVPLVYVFAGLSAAEALWGRGSLNQLRDLTKWLTVGGLKIVLWGFSACLAATGVLTGAVDAGKLKAARTAISGMVPVVGNLVSGVSEAVLSAASLLKSSVGLYGMLAVFGLCLSPFLRLGIQYLGLKLVTAVCGLFGADSQVSLLQKLTEAMGLILAMTAVGCVLALLTLTLCVRAALP